MYKGTGIDLWLVGSGVVLWLNCGVADGGWVGKAGEDSGKGGWERAVESIYCHTKKFGISFVGRGGLCKVLSCAARDSICVLGGSSSQQ